MLAKATGLNNLVSWFSNFVFWQGATNAHSLRSRQEISWPVGLAILFPGKERRMRIALVL